MLAVFPNSLQPELVKPETIKFVPTSSCPSKEWRDRDEDLGRPSLNVQNEGRGGRGGKGFLNNVQNNCTPNREADVFSLSKDILITFKISGDF